MTQVLLSSLGVLKAKKDAKGQNVVFIAVFYNDIDLLHLLNHYGVYAEKDNRGQTPLHIGCRKANIQISQHLVENMHSDVNI